MQHSETYKGVEITIQADPKADGSWTSEAHFPGGQVKAPEPTYPSEEDARQAALQSAVEAIDRSRVSTGKW
jgi:hypothetical protein